MNLNTTIGNLEITLAKIIEQNKFLINTMCIYQKLVENLTKFVIQTLSINMNDESLIKILSIIEIILEYSYKLYNNNVENVMCQFENSGALHIIEKLQLIENSVIYEKCSNIIKR